MKFLLLLYGDETRWEDMSPEEMQESVKVWSAFGRELTESGAYVAGEGLQPTSAATTVRISGGEVVRTDGPFAETREQLGGFYLLECKDIDEAAGWAAKVPDLPDGGSVEVRPVMDYEASGYEQPGAEAAHS
jgi:hypothetical protein